MDFKKKLLSGLLIDHKYVIEHRNRALKPDSPVLRQTVQNPDVFFPSKESVNKYYQNCPSVVQSVMDCLAGFIGCSYKLFDYCGPEDAERVNVLMGYGLKPFMRPFTD